MKVLRKEIEELKSVEMLVNKSLLVFFLVCFFFQKFQNNIDSIYINEKVSFYEFINLKSENPNK